MPRKTTRLYYGVHAETRKPLYWTLKVRNATKSVAIDGTVEDAMKGKAGLSIGCHLSNTAFSNKKSFNHPVLYVSFTKAIALVVTKISNGRPAECVRYRHGYGKYVDLNDKDPSKAIIKQHPHMFQRQFVLGPYKTQQSHWQPEYGRKETGERSGAILPRGEIARMRNAGLVILPLSDDEES